ncbi:uncharacterized protein LOC126293273 [Schistocerca gregaria]|uniref:uncharacterized protein LOC126293273 n=1 Tax=Schistocerca gregaria TaxID=7010 RepID=UPI00211ED74D|nr:uncharacterized protein LOC126293273 [Schistocerca gregaria]XP_049842354.1 uncharacterized protein LOC126293273 [Schistocerca gregaria]
MFTNVHAQEVEDEEAQHRRKEQQPSPSRQRRGSSKSPSSRSPSGHDRCREQNCEECHSCCPEGDQCCCRSQEEPGNSKEKGRSSGSRRGSVAHKRKSVRRGSESLKLPDGAAIERRLARTPSPRAVGAAGLEDEFGVVSSRRRSSSLKIETEGKLSVAPAGSGNRRRSSSLKSDGEARRGGEEEPVRRDRRKSSLYGGYLSPNDALSFSDGVDEAGRRSRRNSSRKSSDSSSFRTDADGHLLCPDQSPSPQHCVSTDAAFDASRRDSRRSVRSFNEEVGEVRRKNSRRSDEGRGLSRTPSPRHGSGKRSGSPRSAVAAGLDPFASRVCFYVDDCVIDDAPPEALPQPRPAGARHGRRATSMRDPGGARRYATKLSRHASDVTPAQRNRAGSVRRTQRGSLMLPGAGPGGGVGVGARTPPEELPPKERRRRTIVMIVGATFMFLLACSVLVVVVTLTHHSFRHPPVDDAVRKENEEYLSAIGRDDSGLSSAGQNVTSGPPPLLLDNP